MQKCQKLFISSIYATVEACGKSTGDVRTALTHALVLALSGNREFNLKRRELLRPDLNTQYATLCKPTTPTTSELFGDDMTLRKPTSLVTNSRLPGPDAVEDTTLMEDSVPEALAVPVKSWAVILARIPFNDSLVVNIV